MKSIFRKILILLFCVYLICGCRKEEIPFVQYENTQADQLTGDTSIFVGVWNWKFTDHYYGWCQNESNYEFLDPVSEQIQFKLEFFENGFLRYYYNDSIHSNYRISFKYIDFGASLFSINLDGFEQLNLSGYNYGDTMICNVPGFIFYPNIGCEEYYNYFIKQ